VSPVVGGTIDTTFSQSKELAFNRMNLMTTISGCRIARWIYAPVPTPAETSKFTFLKKHNREGQLRKKWFWFQRLHNATQRKILTQQQLI